ncbi:FERM and PDZ domain-containing protein 2-like isoform X2 [Penaeus chinensis]|uniref:FERM and PDZ domain-containing protein 2-like isoform X2 n=1 Tax=Penaeus chinensis TaxID=139456 RepID=UPI001FB77C61|nr:FERM and PDZ domain-containing protein 2-like isoform X2 [Penaeus chinensis]
MGVRRRAGGGGRSRLTITTFHLGAVGSRAEPSIRSTVVEESVSDSLVERFLQCPAARGGPERRLDTVTLLKKDGSLGVMIAEGVDHGLYIQAVSPGGPAALQGTLKPGDRIVGINGRSVETLPYAAAVDLLRQISDSVTLLVSQPVVTSSSSSSAPARASSTHTTQAHTTPIVSPDARASAGPGGEAEARERKEARVQLLGGARSFITEVRSGPVTVITLNATPPPASSPAPSDPAPAVSTFEISVGPRVPAEGAQGGGAGGGPAQAASSKQK